MCRGPALAAAAAQDQTPVVELRRDPVARARQVKFQHEVVEVGTLSPHPRNYRKHPEDQLVHIEESIRQHGFYRPIVVAKDGTILAGHGVVEAATRIGFKSVPVVRLSVKPDSKQALQVLTGDNEMSRLAELDELTMVSVLQDLREEEGLLGTGYDEEKLAALLYVIRPPDEVQGFDETAEWEGMPEFTPLGKPLQLVVNFRSEEDRQKFVDEHSFTIEDQGDKVNWSMWWPTRGRRDWSSVPFVDETAEEEQ